ESTFSHPSKLELVAEARRAGFRVVLYHVNVRLPELSVARVAQRVGEGGHDVPEDKIRARYERNQPLIRAAALQADYAFVYDNSSLNVAPERLLAFTHGRVTAAAAVQPAWARQLYAAEIEAFLQSTSDDAAA
ncbi:MAG: hypothetical protein ABJA77_06415, partial [Variovorax sp.]